jgi:uncharacterized protein YbdZ (MbtH family)
LDRIAWRSPRSSCSAGPRSAATSAEVQAILGEVTQIRPELTAFSGCLYYAALRPAEAVALRADSCTLPSGGWGQLTLTASLPRSARAWTGNGTPREPRSLKHRPEGTTRTVPIPPQLARLLRWHLRAFGCAADGRLFQGARGGPLSESLYGRIWHQARAAAIPETGQIPYGRRVVRSGAQRRSGRSWLGRRWDDLRLAGLQTVSAGTPLFQHIGRIPEHSPHDRAGERLSSHALAAPRLRVLGFAHA